MKRNSVVLALLCALFFLFGSLAAQANILYVKTSANGGNDSNNGSSWSAAKATISSALSIAVANTEIRVAAGTYSQTINITKSVKLYGGYQASGTDTRNITINVTTIGSTGSLTDSIIKCTGTSGTPIAPTIDGFTVRGGTGYNRYGDGSKYGGGIYCYYANATITNNIITSNTANYGGGICGINSTVSIKNDTISSNNANTWTSGGTTMSGEGGGIYLDGGPNSVIYHNVVKINSAHGSTCAGGGIYMYYQGGVTGTYVTCNNIEWNLADGSSSVGGGVASTNGGPVRIANNWISQNGAASGAGVYLSTMYSASMITNNTIIYNLKYKTTWPGTVDWTAMDGEGVRCVGPDPDLTVPIYVMNNIIGYQLIGVWWTGNFSTIWYEHNCMYLNATGNYMTDGGYTLDPGYHDITSRPMFVNTSTGDYHLQSTSPCIDAAVTYSGQTYFTGDLDFDLQTRIYDYPGVGTDHTMDIGADEYQ